MYRSCGCVVVLPQCVVGERSMHAGFSSPDIAVKVTRKQSLERIEVRMLG